MRVLVETISLCAATSSRDRGRYFSTHGASLFGFDGPSWRTIVMMVTNERDSYCWKCTKGVNALAMLYEVSGFERS